MAKQVDHKVVYYYDLNPTEEDLMGETSVHAMLVHYLMEVLTQLFSTSNNRSPFSQHITKQ